MKKQLTLDLDLEHVTLVEFVRLVLTSFQTLDIEETIASNNGMRESSGCVGEASVKKV